MTRTYDAAGNVTKRVIKTGGQEITQVPDGDGGWWNIRIQPAKR